MSCCYECSNTFCEFNENYTCYADEEQYSECEDQFITADISDDDKEDYAFADYDCECGLFIE